jgi:FemAB-related protein (PEP-CTERM system-associated)
VRAHPDGSFFHLSGWAEVIPHSFGHRAHYLVAQRGVARNGAPPVIAGVLPLVHLDSLLFGNALISIPFGVYGGVLAQDPEAERALLDAACALARELRVDYLELRNRRPSAGTADWPTKTLYATFRRTLADNDEANLKAIPRKHRAEVRKGLNAGLELHVDTDPGRVYAVYSESVRNLGTPVFGLGYFRKLREVFGEDCDLLSITHGGKVVSGVMTFLFRDECMPFYGGGTSAARALRANDFMYWQVMRRAVQRGVRIFDFGRSKRGTGSFDYKEYWGFEPQDLHYQYYLVRAREIPNVSPNNPKYRLFIRAWQRLPLGVSRALGPLIARNLG